MSCLINTQVYTPYLKLEKKIQLDTAYLYLALSLSWRWFIDWHLDCLIIIGDHNGS